MNKFLLFTFLLFSLCATAQKEGQIFCEGDINGEYFPLLTSTKYIIWENTYYIEKNIGTKNINGKTYMEYSQDWESGDTAVLLLRENEGTIYQYKENTKKDHIRLPKTTTNGTSWQIDNGLTKYEIISLKGELETPVCNYTNLLVLKSSFKNGVFTFYYQKGYGYVGATLEDQIISFVVPNLPEELTKKQN